MEYRPQYRATLYETDEVTPLTPAAGSAHSQPFQVATADGVSGFPAYLSQVKDARGRIDPITKNVEGEGLTLEIIDVSVGTNAQRWVTEFVSDGNGQRLLTGRLVMVEEQLYPGGPWIPWFVGRIESAMLIGRTLWSLKAKNLADELSKAQIFAGRPGQGARGVSQLSLIPLGFTNGWGESSQALAIPVMPGILKVGINGQAQLNVQNSDFLLRLHSGDLTSPFKPHRNMDTKDSMSQIDVRIRLKSPSNPAAPWHNKDVRVTETKYGTLKFFGDGDNLRLDWAHFTEVPQSDPFYVPLSSVPLSNVPCNWYFYRVDKGGTSIGGFAGVAINNTDPIHLLEDVLAGQYGDFGTTGQPLLVFDYDTAGIDRTNIPLGRWRFEEPMELKAFVEDVICKPYNLGYRWDPAIVGGRPTCRFKLFDMRAAAIPASPLTLTDDDLSADGEVEWTHDRNGSARRIEIAMKLELAPERMDFVWQDENLEKQAGKDGGVKDLRFLPEKLFEGGDLPPVSILDFSPAWKSAEGTMKLDSTGLLPIKVITNDGRQVSNNIDKIRSVAIALAKGLADVVHGGPVYLDAAFRRSSANANSCQPGDFRLVDLSPAPNVVTRVRGGARIMQCVSRQCDGPAVRLGFIDMLRATNVVPGAPSFSGLTLNAAGTSINGLLTSTGSRLDVQIAVVAAGAAAPAAGSSEWVYPTYQRLIAGVPQTPATGAGTTPGEFIASWSTQARRVWIRARVAEAQEPVGPWSTPQSLDGAGVAAPTGLSVATLTPASARLTWTPAVGAVATEVLIFNPSGSTTADLTVSLPGSVSEYTFTGVGDPTTYPDATFRAVVRHVSTWDTRSADLSTTFSRTAYSGPDTAPDPISLDLLRGADPLTPESPIGAEDVTPAIELVVVPASAGLDIEIQRRQDTPTVGSWETVVIVTGVEVTGRTKYLDTNVDWAEDYSYRARHVPPLANPSGWTATVAATPVLVPNSELGGSGEGEDLIVYGDIRLRQQPTLVYAPQYGGVLPEPPDWDILQVRDAADTTDLVTLSNLGLLKVSGGVESNDVVVRNSLVVAPLVGPGSVTIIGGAINITGAFSGGALSVTGSVTAGVNVTAGLNVLADGYVRGATGLRIGAGGGSTVIDGSGNASVAALAASGNGTIGGTLVVTSTASASGFRVGGNQVVGARQSGVPSLLGYGSPTSLNGFFSLTANASYNQFQVQSIANQLGNVSANLAALIGAMRAHGLIT